MIKGCLQKQSSFFNRQWDVVKEMGTHEKEERHKARSENLDHELCGKPE